MLLERIIRGTTASALGVCLTLVSLPLTSPVASASALEAGVGGAELPPLFFKKKKKKSKKKRSKKRKKKTKSRGKEIKPEITPAEAEEKRAAIRESVAEAKAKKDWHSVAEGLEYNGEILGDPLTIMEAGEARLEKAREDRSKEEAQRSIDTTEEALDILYFLAAVAAGEEQTDWVVIPPSDAAGLIDEAQQQVSEAQSLIGEIEDEEAAKGKKVAAGPAKTGKDDKKRKRKRKRRERRKRDGKAASGNGTGLIVGGSVLTALGVAGAGMGIAGVAISNHKQSLVEQEGKKMPIDQAKVDQLDKEGKRANILGYAGLGVAFVGLVVGVSLLAVGLKRRKHAGPGSAARLGISPYFGARNGGLVLTGRF